MQMESGLGLEARGASRIGFVIVVSMVWLCGWGFAISGRTQTRVDPPGTPAASVAKAGTETGFVVDGTWPRNSPEGHEWGEMSGLCLDHAGQIWAFHRGKVPVEIYSRGGELVRSWGEGQFGRPHQVRVDDKGRIWMADAGLHVVRQYDVEGHLLRTLGTPGVAGNDRIVKFDAEGRFVKAWGKKGEKPGEFDLPHAIAIDSKERLYVADRSNGRVQIFDGEGTFLAEWAGSMMPWHIVITPADEVYVCGSSFMPKPRLKLPGIPRGIPPKDQIVAKFDTAGRELARWTFPTGRKPGSLEWVHGMAVDADGAIYLGDIRGRRAQRFVSRGGPLANRPKVDADVKRADTEKPK
jgi:sugar lactone lactonase YvrE